MREQAVATSMDMALTGRLAHPTPLDVVADLTVEAVGAKPNGVERSIHELLGHLVFWQDLTLRWLGGEAPTDLVHPDDSWPEPPQPASEEAWGRLVKRFADGLAAARKAATEGDLDAPMPGLPDATRLGCLQVVASHNSWHLGQMMQVRRQLDL